MSKQENQHEFERCFSISGGLAKDFSYLGTIGEEIPLLVEFYNSSFKALRDISPNMPFIYLDIVNSMSVNAHAVFCREKYYIGISLGIILFTADLFTALMSDRCFIKDIGDVEAEREDCVDLNELMNVYRKRTCDSPRAGPPWQVLKRIPHDDKRKSYAHSCIEYTLDFVVAHEIAHIILAHLDFAKAKTGMTMISEIPTNDSAHFDYLTHYALEFQADIHAIGLSCLMKQEKLPQAYDKIVVQNVDTYMRPRIMALTILFFHIFEPRTDKVKDNRSQTHPHQFARFHNVVSSLLANVQMSEDQRRQQFEKTLFLAFRDEEMLARHINTKNKGKISEFTHGSSLQFSLQLDDVQQANSEIDDKLKDIHSELDETIDKKWNIS